MSKPATAASFNLRNPCKLIPDPVDYFPGKYVPIATLLEQGVPIVEIPGYLSIPEREVKGKVQGLRTVIAKNRALSEAKLDKAKAQEMLSDAIRNLPFEQREIVLLYERDGVEYGQISERLSIPVGTVMSRINGARDLIKRHVMIRAHRFVGVPLNKMKLSDFRGSVGGKLYHQEIAGETASAIGEGARSGKLRIWDADTIRKPHGQEPRVRITWTSGNKRLALTQPALILLGVATGDYVSLITGDRWATIRPACGGFLVGVDGRVSISCVPDDVLPPGEYAIESGKLGLGWSWEKSQES